METQTAEAIVIGAGMAGAIAGNRATGRPAASRGLDARILTAPHAFSGVLPSGCGGIRPAPAAAAAPDADVAAALLSGPRRSGRLPA